MWPVLRLSKAEEAWRSKILNKLDALDRKLNLVLGLEKTMSKELDDLKAEVTENTTVVGSAITLLNNLSQMLKDAIASGDPAELTALAATLDKNSSDLAAAVAANTVAVPAPAPPPSP